MQVCAAVWNFSKKGNIVHVKIAAAQDKMQNIGRDTELAVVHARIDKLIDIMF